MLLAGPAMAQDDVPSPAWQGVWQGTIGKLPVRACFQKNTPDYSFGSYYYLAHKRAIQLVHRNDGSWLEGDDLQRATGRWVLADSSGTTLSGEWRHAGKRLSIALTRVPLTGDAAGQPCGSDAYVQPRVAPVRVTERPRKTGGLGWTELTYDVGPGFGDVHISSFGYPSTQPGDPAINAELRVNPAKRGEDNPADYLACMENALGSLGIDGDFHFSYTPHMLTPDYVVARENAGGFCGGAHPYMYEFWKVWRRHDGKPVRLADWLGPAAKEASASGDDYDGTFAQVRPALIHLAMHHMNVGGRECREAVASTSFWYLGLDRRGLLMAPSLPHVYQGCAGDAVIPFTEVAPFLSPEGRQGIERLKSGT
jgi:hypothetical protein